MAHPAPTEKFLTDAERETLNAAEQILINTLVPAEVLMFSLHHGWKQMSATYFTPNNVQHSQLWNPEDSTLAGKVAHALSIRADENGRADQIRADRIAQLKTELDALVSA